MGQPAVGGEVDEVAAGELAADRRLGGVGADQRWHPVRAGDGACFDGRARQAVERGVRRGVEGGIADDERSAARERLVDGRISQERRRGQVGQHVGLAERMPTQGQHLEGKTLQRP